MLADEITPLVLTCNEAPNIARCLDRLSWAKRIAIVDSGSTDDTLAIIARYPRAEVLFRPFDDSASQCNFCLEHIASEWALSLDADYILSGELVAELGALKPVAEIAGYEARFVYAVHNRILRAALYPPRRVLYRRSRARCRNEGHTHRVVIDGRIERLKGVIRHDDRKPLSRWLSSQQRYASIEAEHLFTSPSRTLRRTDRIRRLGWPAPILVFVYTLLVKGCIFDG